VLPVYLMRTFGWSVDGLAGLHLARLGAGTLWPSSRPSRRFLYARRCRSWAMSQSTSRGSGFRRQRRGLILRCKTSTLV